MKAFLIAFVVVIASTAAFAADAPAISQVIDAQIRTVEHDVIPLAEAMPEDSYNFIPTAGAFDGVRSFSQQLTHIAAVNYAVAAAVLGEVNPSSLETDENGPRSIRGKVAIVKYLKDSFEYAHKAAAALTSANTMEMMQSPFGQEKTPKISLLSIVAWHTYDHYGQAVVYARMKGIVPPASRPQ